MIRVLIADDHEVVRAGMRRMLEDRPGIDVCGEATTVAELVEKLGRTRADVVVLDVHMPGNEGPDVVRRLRALPGAPRVVVFTRHAEDSHAVAWLRAGASAFLSKRRSMDELTAAIRKAHEGGRYITPELADHLLAHQIDLTRPARDLLSDREVDVVRRLAEGTRATEIAEALALSTSTVNTYVQRIKTKLGVRTAVEIVEFARENGLLD